MFGKDNTDKARTMYEAYNQRDFDKAASLVAPDFELVNMATGETFRGPEGVKQFLGSWSTAFPDSKCEITNVIDGGDWVVCEFHGKGHHTGMLTGPSGPIPPTGKEVDVPFCDVWQFRDGKAYRGHTYFDMATFMRELGLLPEPTFEHLPETEHYTEP